jgi:hypothetical protein
MGHRRRRPLWWRDETGSLPVALLLVMVSTSISALLVPMVLVQLGSTRVEAQRERSVAAAQAALEVALGQLRRANDGTGAGTPSALPCGSLSGSVGGDAVSTYRVTIKYYAVASPQPVLISCTAAHSGVGLDHALLTATGTALGKRVLTATYKFWWINTNLPGGLIPTYDVPGYPLLCMDAGSASPGRDTPLTMEPCDPGNPRQTWVYNTDLSIMLVSSVTSPNGAMCLDAGPVPHTLGKQVFLEPCASSGPAPYPQMWSLNNHANFEGTADGKTTDTYCFNVQRPGVPDSIVILGSNATATCQGEHDNLQGWQPDASVGAGAAGPKTSQLVNYGQFGRCLDVPMSDVNHAFMIVWPCKQTPDPTAVAPNEKWVNVPSPISPGSDKILLTTTHHGAGRYCLVPPDPGNIYLVLHDCATDAMVTSDMEWTVNGPDPVYKSYWYIDANDRCMSPDDASLSGGPDGPVAGISRVIDVPCDSLSSLLKWNAKPGVLGSLPLTGLREG